MTNIPWTKELPGAITVCDTAGVIVEMNDRSVKAFEKQGGRALIGTNLLDCHPEPSRTKLQQMLTTPQVNAYTIEKGGRRKLIYQTPWYENGRHCGLIEIALPLPGPLPHFVRD